MILIASSAMLDGCLMLDTPFASTLYVIDEHDSRTKLGTELT